MDVDAVCLAVRLAAGVEALDESTERDEVELAAALRGKVKPVEVFGGVFRGVSHGERREEAGLQRTRTNGDCEQAGVAGKRRSNGHAKKATKQ